MFLLQSAYCSCSMKLFEMEIENTASTLMSRISKKYSGTGFLWGRAQGRANIPYRSLIGRSLHLNVHIRQDITFSESILSRFVESSTTAYCMAKKSELCCVQGSQETGIMIGAMTPGSGMRNGPFSKLSAYSNIDWARAFATRKSTDGYVTLLNGTLVACLSFWQRFVAAWSTEAEYVSPVERIHKV